MKSLNKKKFDPHLDADTDPINLIEDYVMSHPRKNGLFANSIKIWNLGWLERDQNAARIVIMADDNTAFYEIANKRLEEFNQKYLETDKNWTEKTWDIEYVGSSKSWLALINHKRFQGAKHLINSATDETKMRELAKVLIDFDKATDAYIDTCHELLRQVKVDTKEVTIQKTIVVIKGSVEDTKESADTKDSAETKSSVETPSKGKTATSETEKKPDTSSKTGETPDGINMVLSKKEAIPSGVANPDNVSIDSNRDSQESSSANTEKDPSDTSSMEDKDVPPGSSETDSEHVSVLESNSNNDSPSSDDEPSTDGDDNDLIDDAEDDYDDEAQYLEPPTDNEEEE